MKKIKPLDGLRGIAILLVIFWHYGQHLFFGVEQSIPYFIQLFHSIAWGGVDLFFVLSGFLIVGNLLDAPKEGAFFKSFYIKRACRILPLYGLMVLILIVVLEFRLSANEFIFSNTIPIASYLTFTQNFFVQTRGWGAQWLGVTWSLAIEEQFYLVIPLVVFMCSRVQMSWLFGFFIVAAPICRAHLDEINAYVLPFARSDAILMGALLAIATRCSTIANWLETHPSIIRVLVIFFALGVLLAADTNPNPGGWFIHFILACFFTSLMVMAIYQSNQPNTNTILNNSVLVWFGLRSYAIYLFHQGIFFVFDSVYTDVPPFYIRVFIIVVAFVVVLLLAEISFRFIEQPILKWGRRVANSM